MGLLVSHNLDKDLLVQYFLERTGAQGGNPALAGKDAVNNVFPDTEQTIYRRLLSHASQLIVDMSSSFPQFDVEVSSELLQRTESLAEQVVDGMNRVVVEQGDAFEADYRNACVRRWDQLELFGVDLNETNKRYNLSVAYVTLMVERLSSETSDEGEVDDTVDADADEDAADIRDSMPADEALAKFNRLIVRGPAGSGKTTLLQWFAVFAAARRLDGDLQALNNTVPFLVKLRNFAEEDFPAPEHFPKEASTAIAGDMPDGWVHEKLKAGEALVLVDGLDEVSEERRNDVRTWLNDLTTAFPDARFLVTSRPHAAEEGWLDTDGFVDAELQDMARGDVDEFVGHWHAAVAETIRDEQELAAHSKLAESLKSKLAKNAAIFRLATSPLLCALLCALHRQRVQNLPADRIELYRLCIEMFMRRDEERRIDATDYIELSNRQKESLLQEFAWWMISNEKTTATPEETIACFQRHYDRLTQAPADGNGKAVMKLFMHRIGIIRQLAHQKIDFPHRTFQEYLAAKAAAEQDNTGVLVKNAHDDQWREVVILAAGAMPAKQASGLISELLKRGDEDGETSLHLVAVAALDLMVAGEEDSNLKADVANRLSKIVPPKNMRAAKQLAIAGDLVVPHLAFRKMKADEAAASVRALALIGSDQAHSTLKNYIGDSRNSVEESFRTSFNVAHDPAAYGKAIFSERSRMRLSGRVTDISWIEVCTSLESLDLSGTQVSDVSSLANLTSLTSLDLDGTQVSDVSCLASLQSLESLILSGTQASDVSSLSHLGRLSIHGID